MPSRVEHEVVTVAGREVPISNPRKVLFPQAGYTKLDVARYYVAVAEGALRAAGGRPNVLVRYPNGIEGEFFYQKRAPESRPDWIEVVALKFPSGRTAEEVVPRDAAALVWMANLACLELHPHPVRADDLKSAEGESGAGGLFDTELTAGLFYGYVVVDVPLLVSNLGGDAALAGKVVEHLTHLIATVSPGAKKGSTAPYAYADLMLIEAGNTQPRTLANAYRTPCRACVDEAVRCMGEYLSKIDRAYGNPPLRAHLSIEEAPLPGSSTKSPDALAAWARDLVGKQTAA